jgi:hypothetical protein
VILFLTLLGLSVSGARADLLGDWFAKEDAVLVVILVDGLVDDFIDAPTIDGDPLMPRTSAWAESAVRFVDVLASSTRPDLARAQLEREFKSFGADSVRVVRGGSRHTDALVEEFALAASRPGRQVLLLDLPWLVPPLTPTRESLLRLDPSPWASMHGVVEMETRVRRRLDEGARLVRRQERGSRQPRGEVLRDTRWFIEAAHADLDARLAPLLDALQAPGFGSRTGVLLTATSSSGLGERGPTGPGVGVELDVARVPVILQLPGVSGRIDHAPRQWIRLDADWCRLPGPDDRLTYSYGPASARARGVCELRWTTPEFTLIDSTLPRRPPRLHDRQLDPGEWLDRAIALPALADSLQNELRARLYGVAPVIVFSAGNAAVDLDLTSQSTMEGPSGHPPESFSLQSGETVRVRLSGGAANVYLGRAVSVDIGGEQFRLTELIVHSPEWKAAMAGPGSDEGFRIWIE